MKDIKDYITEKLIGKKNIKKSSPHTKGVPITGRKYLDEDGDIWLVEELEWIREGDFAEEGHRYIIDEYNDGDYGNIVEGDYDSYEGWLVGCSQGSKKKAFLWDSDKEELYKFYYD